MHEAINIITPRAAKARRPGRVACERRSTMMTMVNGDGAVGTQSTHSRPVPFIPVHQIV
jgi:hypothetical protein